VYVFCAEWCKTCRDLRSSLPASFYTEVRWIDIEEFSAWADELPIELFPTIAIYRDGRWTHWGATEPCWAQIEMIAHSSTIKIEPGILEPLEQIRASHAKRGA
jgi:hypothetical protein